MQRQKNKIPPLPPLPKPRYIVVKGGDVPIYTASDDSKWIQIQCFGNISGWYGDFSSDPDESNGWGKHRVFFPATNEFMSPTMFERLGGKGSNHRWKLSIGVLLPNGDRGMDIGDWLVLHGKSGFVPTRSGSPKKRRKKGRARGSPPPDDGDEEDGEAAEDDDEEYNEEDGHGSPSRRPPSRSRALPTTPTTAISRSLALHLAIHSPLPEPTLSPVPGILTMTTPVEDHASRHRSATTESGRNPVSLFQSEMLPKVQRVQQEQQLSIVALTDCPPPPYPYVLYGPTGNDLAFNSNLIALNHVQNPALTREDFATVTFTRNASTVALVETELPIGGPLAAAAFLHDDDLHPHGGFFNEDSSSDDMRLVFGNIPEPAIPGLSLNDDDGAIFNGGGGSGLDMPDHLHPDLPHLRNQHEIGGGSRDVADLWNEDDKVESLSALLGGGGSGDGERLSDGSSSYEALGGVAFAPPSPGELIDSPIDACPAHSNP